MVIKLLQDIINSAPENQYPEFMMIDPHLISEDDFDESTESTMFSVPHPASVMPLPVRGSEASIEPGWMQTEGGNRVMVAIRSRLALTQEEDRAKTMGLLHSRVKVSVDLLQIMYKPCHCLSLILKFPAL